MPNCREHEDCDLVCDYCGDYYCRGCAESLKFTNLGLQEWKHVKRPDMPDDIEAYRNEKAEEMP